MTRVTTREPMSYEEWMDIAKVLYLESRYQRPWEKLTRDEKDRWVNVAKMASCIFEDIEDVE